MNSEVFSEYSTWLRGILTKYNIKVMTIGYSGGMCGYLPTNKAIIDGGYEVENAPKLFDSNSFTLGSVERTIKKNISSIYVEKLYRSNRFFQESFTMIYTKTGLIRNIVNDIYFLEDDLITH